MDQLGVYDIIERQSVTFCDTRSTVIREYLLNDCSKIFKFAREQYSRKNVWEFSSIVAESFPGKTLLIMLATWCYTSSSLVTIRISRTYMCEARLHGMPNWQRKGSCQSTGVTYELVSCQAYQCRYVGKTSRSAYARGRGHIKALQRREDGSVMWRHGGNIV